MGFEALPQTSNGSNLAINSRLRFALALWMFHQLASKSTHPSVQGLTSHRIGHTVRLGGPERAHATTALEQVCTVSVRAQESQHYALGAPWFSHFGSSSDLAQILAQT